MQPGRFPASKAAHVAAKGFCTVDPRLDDDLLRSGREDVSPFIPLKHLKTVLNLLENHFKIDEVQATAA